MSPVIDLIIDLFLFAAISLVVWHLVSLVYNIYVAHQAIKIIDQRIIEAVEKKLDSIKVIEVNIEKHQETFYLFNRETNEFVAQGKTKDELVDAINRRFKGCRVLAQEEQLKELGLDW